MAGRKVKKRPGTIRRKTGGRKRRKDRKQEGKQPWKPPKGKELERLRRLWDHVT